MPYQPYSVFYYCSKYMYMYKNHMNHTDSSVHHNCKGALCDQKLGIIISRYLIHLCEACDMAKSKVDFKIFI